MTPLDAKTAQERGLMLVATMVRQLTPPDLEALIIIYNPETPEQVSSVMATCGNMADTTKHSRALARARTAARAFVDAQPNSPGFNPQS